MRKVADTHKQFPQTPRPMSENLMSVYCRLLISLTMLWRAALSVGALTSERVSVP